MVIQFSCPLCHQPIEVDDDQSGRHVGCPFCQRIVTAPTLSTLKLEMTPDSPVARKISRPAPINNAPFQNRSNKLAVVGFILSLSSLFLFVAGSLIGSWYVYSKLGPVTDPQEVQKKMVEVVMKEGPSLPVTFMGGSICLSFLLWAAGVCCCSIVLFQRTPVGRGFAIAGLCGASLLPLLFSFQLLLG